MKIIYLLINRFSERDYKRFGIELLERKGNKVEAWDCVNLIFPYFDDLTKHQSIDEFKKNLIQFRDIAQLKNKIKGLDSNTVFVLLGTVNQKGFIDIIRIINEKKLKYGIVYLANLPNIKVPLFVKIFIFFKKPKIFLNKIKIKFRKQNSKMFDSKLKPDFIFYSGRAIKLKLKNLFSKTKDIISVPSLDFDFYHQQDRFQKFKDEDYAVFLDEDNLDHPDIKYHNTKSNVNSNFYLTELNQYFKKFEKKNKLKIIIAGHPKANYDQKKNIFNGRTIIQHETKELIKNSKSVLLHCSTSVSFAILARKPLLFISSSNYSSEYQYLIEIMSRELGQKPIDISKKSYSIEVPKLNNDLYSNYELNYLSEYPYGENFLPVWETLNKYLKNLNNNSRNEY